MTTIQDEAAYKAYFQALATSHVDITNFIFGDEDAINCAQTTELQQAAYTMWLEHYPPVRAAGERDNYVGILKVEFSVMFSKGRTETRAEADAYLKICEDIVQQIAAKVEYDFQISELVNEPQWTSFVFGRMEDAIIGATEYVGIKSEIDFLVPLKTYYDETKWS